MNIPVEVVVAFIALLSGGGGVLAWFRLKAEAPQLIVTAATGLVVTQSNVIDDLREEIAAVNNRLDKADRRAKVAEDRARIAERDVGLAEKRAEEAERQRDLLLRANDELRGRIEHLEEQMHRLNGDAG